MKGGSGGVLGGNRRLRGFPRPSLSSPWALKRANVEGESGVSQPLNVFTDDVTARALSRFPHRKGAENLNFTRYGAASLDWNFLSRFVTSN